MENFVEHNDQSYLKPKQISYRLASILSRKLHYCDTVDHPAIFHFLVHFSSNLYLAVQSCRRTKEKKKRFSLTRTEHERIKMIKFNVLTIPSSLDIAKMCLLCPKLANFEENIGGSGLKSTIIGGAIPFHPSLSWTRKRRKATS